MQDSLGFWIPHRGLRIPIVRGIPDSLSYIRDSKAKDSGFHKQNFPGFRIPQVNISQIPEYGFPFMGRERGTPVKAA